ncbi:transcriptional activator MetR [Vibrio astriarenae]|nr:transcriptional activator MetR [Vibrio sp. C7]
MLDLKHLKTLATLRDTGSLTATATSLHLTQSALSHQIKDLEARLGSQLFLRKTKPVRFTSEGDILLKLADEVLPRIAKAENDLASLKRRCEWSFAYGDRVPLMLPVADARTQRVSSHLAECDFGFFIRVWLRATSCSD